MKVFFERSLSDSAEQDLSWAEIIGFTVINRLNDEVVEYKKLITPPSYTFEIKTTGKEYLGAAHELIHRSRYATP